MKTILHRFRAYLLMLLLPILFFSCSTRSTDRIKVIKQAFNTKDIDNTIARCYTDDIIFEIDAIKGQGKKVLRGAAEWDSVINTRLSFSDFRIVRDTIFCKCLEQNDISKLQGMDKGYFDPVTFIFQDGLIKYMKFQSTAESHQTKLKASNPFLNWLYTERNDQLEKLMTNGKFVLNATSAQGYLELVREWRVSVGKE